MSLLYGLSENKLQSCRRAEAYPTGGQVEGPYGENLVVKNKHQTYASVPSYELCTNCGIH